MLRRLLRPRSLRGEVTPPGDKSITHRAFILNGLASGPARIRNFGQGSDCFATLDCLRALGVVVEEEEEEILIRGHGAGGLVQPSAPLDAGNSGTTIRLLSGLLASLPFQTTITGDDSLRRRPMDRIIEPLRMMGAAINGSGESGSAAPLEVRGGSLRGITYPLPVASAQVKSAVLIAGLNAEGETVVEEPFPSRDHTERMLRAMGGRIHISDGRIAVQPGPLTAQDVTVPGDFSSAAFWLIAACLHPYAEVMVWGTGMNPYRTGLLDVLQEMGADITVEGHRLVGGEPVADIRARSSRLRGVSIGGAIIPRLIDELPLAALAGALATGSTQIRDAAELRVKESDRIATTCAELAKMGAQVEELPDGMIVHGGGGLNGAACDSHGDHRLAMALAVAGLVAGGETTVDGAEAASVSYPGFWTDLDRLVGDIPERRNSAPTQQ